MPSDNDILLPVLKFLAGETDKFCRLCFDCTQENGVYLEDSVDLPTSYTELDKKITYMDMLIALDMPMEYSLPFMLCTKCADSTKNSYLFLKLCQHSHVRWNKILDKICLGLPTQVDHNVQTVYLIMDKDNFMLTTRRTKTLKNKKTALNKIKDMIKNRKTYDNLKKQAHVMCEECGEKFPTKIRLVKHMSTHSNKKYPCLKCPKVFTSQRKVDEHSERLHQPKKIMCPKCSKMFTTLQMLRYHDKMNHIAAICKLCFVQFPSHSILRQHLNKHNLNKCPQCEKSFLNIQTYKSHLKICQDDKSPRFFCDICNKGYARKNGIRTHLKTSHGFGKVLACNWCDKKFDAISKLKCHTVKHTKEKNFHCEHCGGKFVTQKSLEYHVRLHTGEKPFPCDICGERFLSASRRAIHKYRKHIGPTKECEVCHSKFVTNNQLRNHMNRHNNPLSRLFVGHSDNKREKCQTEPLPIKLYF